MGIPGAAGLGTLITTLVVSVEEGETAAVGSEVTESDGTPDGGIISPWISPGFRIISAASAEAGPRVLVEGAETAGCETVSGKTGRAARIEPPPLGVNIKMAALSTITRNTPTETATSRSFLFSINGSPLLPKSRQSGFPAGLPGAGKQKPDIPGYL
jgi:hypothetical protein